MNLIVKKTP
jgi:hypothetical protein